MVQPALRGRREGGDAILTNPTWIICHDATKGADAYAMECLRCGEKQRVALPIGLQMYAAMAKVFTKRHKKCKGKK